MQSSPKKVVWSSKGSANVLDDHSIELRGSNDWQEVTLHFQPPELAKIKRVLLEVLPSTRSHANGDRELVLFDIKPHLERVENGTTRLKFRSCRFLGNEADETAANCIDVLSDTGWTVPDFVGNDACHQLVLELRKPVTVQRDNMFALTIDSGGAPDLKQLSPLRISFSGTNVVANQHQNAAISAGTQDRTILEGCAVRVSLVSAGSVSDGLIAGNRIGVWRPLRATTQGEAHSRLLDDGNRSHPDSICCDHGAQSFVLET